MREEVRVDLFNLIEDTSTARYLRRFGADNAILKDKGMGVKYTLVTDENARFLNLFGLSVDANSGDIALGYFPNSNLYIKVGNMFNKIRDSLLCGKGDLSLSDDDCRYIIEGLKVNPKFRASYYSDIEEMIINDNKSYEYNSIILNIVSSRFKFGNDDNRYLHNLRNGNWVESLIKECIVMSMSLENVSKDYFLNFISEDNSFEVINNSRMSVVELLESRKPNMESLMLKYLGYGIPIEFLTALKSYGFGIKQRKICLPVGNKSLNRELGKLPFDTIMNIGECLSSLSYVDDMTSDPIISKTYNIMDLFRAVNAEHEVLFSLEVLKEGNGSLYYSIAKKFNIDDILMESKLSEKDFIVRMSKYKGRFLSLIDRGSMYSRNVMFKQYSFISYGGKMIENSGKIFEKVMRKVMKNFREES